MFSFNPLAKPASSAPLSRPMHSLINPPLINPQVRGAPQAPQQRPEQGGGDPQTPKPLAKLEEKLLETLAKRIPGMGIGAAAKRARDDSPESVSPESIAERIARSFAKGMGDARAQGRSDLRALYDSAIEGLEQGFREIRKWLQGQDLLSGKLAKDVDDTERLTREALAALKPGDELTLGRGQRSMSALSIDERYQRADSFELTLTTRAGNQVRIRFDQQQEEWASMRAIADGNGLHASAFSLGRDQMTRYGFVIEGKLSDDEMRAIHDLVQDVSRLADEFFHGDVQQAFAQAGNLRFDSSQIAAFDLSMTRSEQYSAVRAYQETQLLGDTAPQRARPGLRLGQLMTEMRQRFNDQVLAFLERPQASAAQLMQGLVEQDTRFKTADTKQQSLLQANLERLLGAFNQAN